MTILTSGPTVYGSGAATHNYADLIVDAGEYAGRNDVGGLWPTFLRLAEAKLNDSLRVGQMMTEVLVSLVDGVGSLPSDFLEAYDYIAPEGSTFEDFAIIGSEIQGAVPWTGDLTLIYYAALPPLSIDNPSNWLLDDDYNIYLYALVTEVCIWAKDFETAKLAAEQKTARVEALMTRDERYRWGRARVQNLEMTP